MRSIAKYFSEKYFEIDFSEVLRRDKMFYRIHNLDDYIGFYFRIYQITAGKTTYVYALCIKLHRNHQRDLGKLILFELVLTITFLH